MYITRTHFIHLSLCTLLLLAIYTFPSLVRAAELYVSPQSINKTVGQTFTTTVYVATGGSEPVNAVSGTITYSKDTLDLLSVSSSGSVIDFWSQEPAEVGDTARFEGVIFNPGYTGSAGKVVSLQFKTKAPGAGTINFTQGTVLANDGLGSDVTSRLGNATVAIASSEEKPTSETVQTKTESVARSKIAGPVLSSATHPDSSRWYNKTAAELSWRLDPMVTGVRLLVDRAPATTPTVVYSPPVSEKIITDLSEGVWYAHAQFRDANGWGLVTHFPIRIDTTPPTFKESILPENTGVFGRTIPLVLDATDTVSGIERYEIVIDEREPIVWVPSTEGEGLTTPALSSGEHSIRVTAFDTAENSTTQEVVVKVEGTEPPVVAGYTQKLVLGDTFTIAGLYPVPGAVVEIRFGACESRADMASVVGVSSLERECTYDTQILRTVITEKGTFSFSEKSTDLKVGLYTVVLRVSEGNGVYSEDTDLLPLEVVARTWIGSDMLRGALEMIGLFVVLIAALAIARFVFFKALYGAALLWRRMCAVWALFSRGAAAMRILGNMEEGVGKKLELIDHTLSKKELQDVKEKLEEDFTRHMEDLKRLLRE